MNSASHIGDNMSGAPQGPQLRMAVVLVLVGFLGLMVAATDSVAGPGQYGPGQYGPGQYGPGPYGPGQYTTTQPTTTTTTSTTTTQATTTTATPAATTQPTTTTSTSTTTTQPTTTTMSCYARDCVGGGRGSQDDGFDLNGALIASPASPPASPPSGALTGADVIQIVAMLMLALGVAMPTVSTVRMRRKVATSDGAVNRSS